MEFTQRKHPRLKSYDYAQPGSYAVTVCTHNRRPVLSQIFPPKNAAFSPAPILTEIGRVANHYLRNIPQVYPSVSLDHYVIMPNHIHMLLTLRENAPSLPSIIRSFKSMTTREIGYSIWQSSYFDVVIRNETMYQQEWAYIEGNPSKWLEDELYTK